MNWGFYWPYLSNFSVIERRKEKRTESSSNVHFVILLLKN